MNMEKIKLKNKLETIFINLPGSQAATVQIWFRAGSTLEQESEYGIAHFLEHMFFKGTPTRPGPKIAAEVESFGGEVNAFTSFDYTCYYINTPNSCISNSTEILLDMVSHPLFSDQDIPAERDVVFEEYRRSVDNPNQFGFFKLQKDCFTGGYQHPILGNENTIKNFSRDQVTSFRKRNYNLSNSLLVVAGDLNHKDQIIKIIEGYQIPDGPKSTFEEFKLNPQSTCNVHNKDVRMAQLTINIQAPPFLTTNSSSEDLAINCLAYGETSRLYKDLVLDTSLANSVSGSTLYFSNGGTHFLRISFPPKNATKVYQRLLNVLNGCFKNEFTNEEITKIKNQYIASKIYARESIESYAFNLGHGYAQNGDINCEEKFIESIRKENAKSVNQSMREIFKKVRHIHLQIPQKENVNKHTKQIQDLNKKINQLSKSLKETKSPLQQIEKSKFDPQVQLIKVKPGVKLLYRKNDMTPTFVLHAYLRGGLSHESPNNNGIFNLLSSTITKGHDGISYEKIKKDIEEVSASLSGFSGKNAYGITLHGQSEHFNILSNHFFGSFLRPDFKPTIISHEKEMIKRAIDSQKEDPVRHCFKIVNNLFFKGHPYSYDILGTPKSIASISRNSLLKTHNERIKKEEIVITYCGNFELDHVLDLLKPQLDLIEARKSRLVKSKKVIKKIKNQNEYLHFDREQSQVFIGQPGFKLGDKSNTYLEMIHNFLSGQSSELFVEVRDKKGLCYSVQPVHFTGLEAGYFGIYIASGHDKVSKAIEAIEVILNKIQKNGLTEDDLTKIKKGMEGQSLINIQTNDDYASVYSIPTLQGQGLDFHHLNIEKIKNVKLEEINVFLKKYLKEKRSFIVVGRTNPLH